MKTYAYYNEFDKKAADWLRQLIKNGDITDGVVDERSILEVTESDVRGFRRVHWFAGIGTWDYALNQSGWGDRPVWTASLPCQPFSTAGKGRGKEDERHLLPHYLELVRQCKPNTQLGEQVESAIRHGWLDDLQTNMEAEGYAVGHCVLGAHSVGQAHIRQRLYWVADSNNERSQRRQLLSECATELSTGKSCLDGGMGDTSSATSERDTRSVSTQEERVDSARKLNGAMRFRPTDASEIDWVYCRDNKYRPIKPGIFKMVDGFTAGMVCSCNTIIKRNKFKEGGINDSEHKVITGKTLSSLLVKDGEEKIQRCSGEYEQFYQKKILQQDVYGKCLRGDHKSHEPQELSKAVNKKDERELRGVFKNKHIACPSCGRKCIEQQRVEFDDAVFGMSQGSTLSELFCTKGTNYLQALRKNSDEERPLLDSQHTLSEVWESLDDEEKDRVRIHFNRRMWFIDESIFPLVNGTARGVVPSGDPIKPNDSAEVRAMRLKGYGNAIVAPLAIEFISAFMDVRP